MKRVYETPVVEKLAFQYREQIVARSGETPDGTAKDANNNNICDPAEMDMNGCISSGQ